MSRDQTEQIVGRLDAALSEALTVITQLFLHASILKAQEHPLAKRCYQEWVEIMRRSDRLLEGILDLGGRPSSRIATRLELGRVPRRIFELDIARAKRWVALLEATAAECVSAGAHETASMLRELLDAESVSLAWRRSQRDELPDSRDAVTSSPSIDGALTEALDNVLRAELSAITQVYYHGQLFEAWGAEELGAFLANETWEKTWRSLELTERLLATGAYPTKDEHGELRIGRDIGEILDRDRDLVDAQLAALDTALERCDATLHPEIHDLLSRMRVGEQRHADWIAAQTEEITSRDAADFRA
jgi:bacterioferritin